eukprot:Rhum_TRINITY_DN14345_c13_g1::Rhum_TRINITY_DN14345_c13_g1_i1::g.84725::m.84725
MGTMPNLRRRRRRRLRRLRHSRHLRLRSRRSRLSLLSSRNRLLGRRLGGGLRRCRLDGCSLRGRRGRFLGSHRRPGGGSSGGDLPVLAAVEGAAGGCVRTCFLRLLLLLLLVVGHHVVVVLAAEPLHRTRDELVLHREPALQLHLLPVNQILRSRHLRLRRVEEVEEGVLLYDLGDDACALALLLLLLLDPLRDVLTRVPLDVVADDVLDVDLVLLLHQVVRLRKSLVREVLVVAELERQLEARVVLLRRDVRQEVQHRQVVLLDRHLEVGVVAQRVLPEARDAVLRLLGVDGERHVDDLHLLALLVVLLRLLEHVRVALLQVLLLQLRLARHDLLTRVVERLEKRLVPVPQLAHLLVKVSTVALRLLLQRQQRLHPALRLRRQRLHEVLVCVRVADLQQVLHDHVHCGSVRQRALVDDDGLVCDACTYGAVSTNEVQIL